MKEKPLMVDTYFPKRWDIKRVQKWGMNRRINGMFKVISGRYVKQEVML